MTRLVKPSFLIAFVLALLAAGWIYSGQMEDDPFAFGSGDDTEAAQTADAAGDGATSGDGLAPPSERELPAVRTSPSEAEPHRALLIYTGRTEVARRGIVRAETEGRVVEIAAEESARIGEGDLIVELAANDRYARLREAEALVSQREIEFDAAKQLAGKGYQTEAARAQAEANLSAARAALERIRVDLSRITIEAPFEGIVESRMVEIGDYVQPGMEIAQIVDFDPIVVTIQVSEREISKVEAGVMAEVELVSGEIHPALVSRISTTADTLTRTFEVELEIANEDALIRDGMTAKVLLPAQQVMAHKISPALLALSDEGAVGVKAVGEDNRVVFHPIEIVEDTADGMWVSGLPRKATLISVGGAYVAPGVEVRPVPTGALPEDRPTGPAPAVSSALEEEDRS
jgi:multidrug efflux system membrane fusion protein